MSFNFPSLPGFYLFLHHRQQEKVSSGLRAGQILGVT